MSGRGLQISNKVFTLYLNHYIETRFLTNLEILDLTHDMLCAVSYLFKVVVVSRINTRFARFALFFIIVIVFEKISNFRSFRDRLLENLLSGYLL